MKKFNFGKRNQEKYQKKNEMYVNNLNNKLKILSGATSSNNSVSNKTKTNSANKIKTEIIGKTKIKNSIVDEITKDNRNNVINDFSRNLDGVFDELKQIQGKPKAKRTPKEIAKALKNKKNTLVRNIAKSIENKKKEYQIDTTKMDEDLRKLKINIHKMEENKQKLSTVSKQKKAEINTVRKAKTSSKDMPDYEEIPTISSINSRRAESIKEAFKEIQDIKNGKASAREYVKNERYKIKTPDYYRKIRRRFSTAGVVTGCLFITIFFTSLHGNYILAAGEEEKKAIAEFEQNKAPMNTMGIIANNISNYTKKDIVTEEITLEYETQYMDNDQMPIGETRIIQAGEFGYKNRTVIRTYESDTLIDEKIINEELTKSTMDEVIEVGKSQFLADKKAHVNEEMFTIEEVGLHENASEDSREKCTIYQYVPVKLLYVMDNNWCIVTVDGMEGYVNGDKITTEGATPGILEKVRVQKLKLSLEMDMPLNRPSGFTESDFIRVLSNNSQDENGIFASNARMFYEMENKYGVNGIFLASIGIHESDWGRSSIAQRKKNLFGYGAYDDTPFASSYTFDSYEYGIELVAKVLVKYYLNEEGTSIYDGETAVGTYYNGPTANGVGQRYASDPDWGNKVFNTMEYLYSRIDS
ncbi:MAG: G5 domain-containing protein [Clostridia bacterium]|nr:G5 domain-containing protein [Clostridia bacterium]